MLVTGEGGLLTTNDERIYRRALEIASSGRVPDTFWLTALGKKFAMSNLAASLGTAQFLSIERQIAKKRLIRDWYLEEFREVPGLTMQLESAGTRSICWMSSIRWESEDSKVDDVRQALKNLGIDTRQMFPPISSYPIWSSDPISESRNSGELSRGALNLPSGVNLTKADVKYVAEKVISVLG